MDGSRKHSPPSLLTPGVLIANILLSASIFLLAVVLSRSAVYCDHALLRVKGSDAFVAAPLEDVSAVKLPKPPTHADPPTDALFVSFSALSGFSPRLASPPPADVCPRSDPAWAVANNPRLDFDLFTYGTSEFISGYCLRGGGAIFFEEHETNLLIALLRAAPGGRSVGSRDSRDAFFKQPWLFDVGANLGVHTVSVGAAGFGVLAIEANPATAARLRCSVATNALRNVVVLNAAAVGVDSPLTVCMKVPQANNVGTSFVSSGACEAGAASVPTLVLDRLFAALPPALPAPAVLKMDIEGFEVFALRGGDAWLKRSLPPFVLIEVQVSILLLAVSAPHIGHPPPPPPHVWYR